MTNLKKIMICSAVLIAAVLIAAVIYFAPGRQPKSAWVPSMEGRGPYLEDWTDHPEILSYDGAPLRAEDLCADFAWLLTHRLPGEADIPDVPYDQGLALLFRGYGDQAEKVRVLETARLTGEPGSGEGAFRVTIQVKALIPAGDGTRENTPRFSRTGKQDWVLDIGQPDMGFDGPFLGTFQSMAKYEDIQAAAEQLGPVNTEALTLFIALVCGPDSFASPGELAPEKLILYAMIRESDGGSIMEFTQEQVDAACRKYYGLDGLEVPPGSQPPMPQYNPATGIYSWGGFGYNSPGLSVYRVVRQDNLLRVTAGLWSPPVAREFVVEQLADGLRFLSAEEVEDADAWLNPDWEASRRDTA